MRTFFSGAMRTMGFGRRRPMANNNDSSSSIREALQAMRPGSEPVPSPPSSGFGGRVEMMVMQP